jgi:D-alanyl-D-alanine carboxypeptidase
LAARGLAKPQEVKMTAHSYREKTFVVENSDARLRRAENLSAFVLGPGGAIKTIAPGTSINISEVRTTPAGSKSVNLFVLARSADSATELGWTSANNLAQRLLSETIGAIEPVAGTNQFGPNAAWSNGRFLGQITLIRVVGTNREIEHVAAETAEAFLAMGGAAQSEGRSIGLNSGFRSYPEQKQLSDGWQRRLPGFNPANPPGFSNHQNGIAFDFDVGAGPGNPAYDWMARNATQFGFVRTVKREVWHWEFLPDKAEAARRRGAHESF